MPQEFEIWFDAHFSSAIAKWLKDEFGYDCKSSFVLKLYGLEDIDIYYKAKASAKMVILLSKDSDLPDIIQRLGAPPKLISLQVGNIDNRLLFVFLKRNIERCIRLLLQFDRDVIELKYLEP